jgi:hypothetical protein
MPTMIRREVTGEVEWERARHDVTCAEPCSVTGFVGRMNDDTLGRSEGRPRGDRIARPPLMREHVVRDEHDMARATRSLGAERPRERDQGGGLERIGHDHDED